MVRFLSSSIFIVIFLFAGLQSATAQDDRADSLLNMLYDNQHDNKPNYTVATFKSTHIIDGQSVETLGKGVLDFRVSHRFGALNQGANTFFGLDNAVTKLFFDYGVTDRITVGLGRGTYEKEFDGYLKIKLLRQTERNTMPVTVTYVGDIYCQSLRMKLPDGSPFPFENRLSYMNQLLIARKFNRVLSLQIMPTFLHYNYVPTTPELNNLFAMGFAGRIKVSNHMAITAEYFYTFRSDSHNPQDYHNALSVGLDIETGGHVFQLLFSNAAAINERAVIGQTTGKWDKNEIHFGFNISRVFTIVRPKGYTDSKY